MTDTERAELIAACIRHADRLDDLCRFYEGFDTFAAADARDFLADLAVRLVTLGGDE